MSLQLSHEEGMVAAPRTFAIIAHVDHGKTTLVDQLLKQGGVVQDHQEISERAMDKDIERERGLTILAKCTSVYWKEEKINIIDTPGHADFGGEVERIMGMVDGVLLLVDAIEGVMPQTKFVLQKAVRYQKPVILVMNKADRPDAFQKLDDVYFQTLQLLDSLGASTSYMDSPVLYASGRAGWATCQQEDVLIFKDRVWSSQDKGLAPLFNMLVQHIPPRMVKIDAGFAMSITLLARDPHLGRLLIGRVDQGILKANDMLKSISYPDNLVLEQGRATRIFSFQGMDRLAIDSTTPGDIVAIAGFPQTSVGYTLCSNQVTKALPTVPLDPPTLSITITPNTSPLKGKDGHKMTANVIADRLRQEVESNAALQMEKLTEKEGFEIFGRGELQLGVLIETMRREGFEMCVGRPRVLFQKNEAGNITEPYEEVQVDVEDTFANIVIEQLTKRKGMMQNMETLPGGMIRMMFHIPSRGLIGFYPLFMTETRGTGILNRSFLSYEPYAGDIKDQINGDLISMQAGTSTAYALNDLEARGKLYIGPGAEIYAGMIIGRCNQEKDMEVNPVRAKKLTNMRASGTDEAIRLEPHEVFSVEKAIASLQEDMELEVTPKNLRFRKIYEKRKS
jgi:GTP-binding protein